MGRVRVRRISEGVSNVERLEMESEKYLSPSFCISLEGIVY